MSRDASGTYTLPAGNPVASGTTIESGWCNGTMNDIKEALTDSLSRTGLGGMSQAFKFVNGSLGAPGASFINDATTGMWLGAAADLRFSSGGVQALRLQGTAATFSGTTAATGSYTGSAVGGIHLSNFSDATFIVSAGAPSDVFTGTKPIQLLGSSTTVKAATGGLTLDSTLGAVVVTAETNLQLSGGTGANNWLKFQGGNVGVIEHVGTAGLTLRTTNGNGQILLDANNILTLRSSSNIVSLSAGSELIGYADTNIRLRKAGNSSSTALLISSVGTQLMDFASSSSVAFEAVSGRNAIIYVGSSNGALVATSTGVNINRPNNSQAIFVSATTTNLTNSAGQARLQIFTNLTLPSLPVSVAAAGGAGSKGLYNNGDGILRVA